MNIRFIKTFVVIVATLASLSAYSKTCDVDGDGDIDKLDINEVFAARGQNASAADDPRDADGNGVITSRDGRMCSLQCDAARCAIVEPAPAIASLSVQLFDSLSGTVAEASATVMADESTFDGNQDGTILIEGLLASELSTVHFSAPGYASQVQRFSVGPRGSTTDYPVTMIKRQPAVRISAQIQQSLVGFDGAKVSFAANAFVDQQGQIVTGDIDVFITPVDVSVNDLANAFPGAYAGIAENEAEAEPLVSFGTTEYFFSQNGEELQLASGHQAMIELPIYATQYPSGESMQIGDEIPLWYLNESTGIWEQEGFGQVVASNLSTTGLALRGEVSHFSWWNVDVIPGGAGDPLPPGSNPANPPPTRFTVNLKVVVENDSLEGLSTYAKVTGSNINIARKGTIQMPINTVVGLLVIRGTTCFDASAFLVDQENTELLGASPRVCVEMLTEQDDGKLVELVIDQNENFWGILTMPTCHIVDEPFRTARVVAVKGVKVFSYFSLLTQENRLPEGVFVNGTTGVISGTPTETGDFNVGMLIQEGNGDNHLVGNIPIVVNEPLTLETQVPEQANLHESYQSEVISTSGGCPPYRYKLAEGELPDGVVLDGLTGVISGVPTAPATGSFLLETVDGEGNRVRSQPLTISFGTPALSANTLPSAIPGQLWTAMVEDLVSNLGGPIDEFVVTGLPDWLTFDPESNEFSGTPSESGIVTFLVRAINVAGESEVEVTLAVSGAINPPTNITANSVGTVLNLTWQAVENATGYIVRVVDTDTDIVVRQIQVSENQAWIPELDPMANLVASITTLAGTSESQPSETLAVSIGEMVPTLNIVRDFDFPYERPNDIYYRPQTGKLLIAGGGIISVDLNNPDTYGYAVGDANTGIASSLFADDASGITYSVFDFTSFRYKIRRQSRFDLAATDIKTLIPVRGYPVVNQGENNSTILAYNQSLVGGSVFRISRLNSDGTESFLVNNDDFLKPGLASDVFYRQELILRREIAAIGGTALTVVPVKALTNAGILGESLLLIDQSSTDPDNEPSLFPLQNCSPLFDFVGQGVVDGQINDLIGTGKPNELLALIDNPASDVGGLLKLNTLSGQCVFVSGLDALGDTYGEGEYWDPTLGLVSELTLLNSQYALVIVGVPESFQDEVYRIWLVDLSSGNRTKLLNIRYSFEGTDA